jgi:Flp pilus assembly pilin Flp
MKTVTRIFPKQIRGQAIEYGLTAALILVAIVASATGVGTTLHDFFAKIGAVLHSIVSTEHRPSRLRLTVRPKTVAPLLERPTVRRFFARPNLRSNTQARSNIPKRD